MIVVIIVVVLVLDGIISMQFQQVAEEKGYTDSNKYFWMTFLFGFIGMLLVVALPDRNLYKIPERIMEERKEEKKEGKREEINNELPDL